MPNDQLITPNEPPMPSLADLFQKHRTAAESRPRHEESGDHAHPRELPADTLIGFSQFAHLMPGVTRRWIEKASKEGRFVPGSRLTPRSPMMFRAGAVSAYLEGLCVPAQKEAN